VNVLRGPTGERLALVVAVFVAAVAPASGEEARRSATGLSTLNYVSLDLVTEPPAYLCENFDGTPCSGSEVVPGTAWILNYSAQSTAAGYGVLKGQASVFLTGDDSRGPFPSHASVGGRASFRDTLTFHGGEGSGTAVFGFTVHGTSAHTSGGNGRPQFALVPIMNGALDYANQVGFGVLGGKAKISVPFTFGQPIEFQIDFYALAQIYVWQAGATASADYRDTAILSSIVVKDSHGATVSGFTITSESGTPYTANGVSRPLHRRYLRRASLLRSN
jgi:hypothetical protein